MSDVFTDWEVRILQKPAGSLLANGKVTIAGTVRVAFSIIKGPKGVFAGLPTKMVEKNGEKNYYPEVKIPDQTTYAQFQTEALAAFEAAQTNPPEPKAATVNKTNVPF